MKTTFTIALALLVRFASGQTYALIADKLIDPKNGKVLENPTVIVYKNHITGVNYNNHIPDSATVINLKGYTLLPGLMDVHTHILADGGDYDKDLYGNSPAYRSLRAVKYLSKLLDQGVTTIRDVCTEGAGFSDFDIGRAVDSGFFDGPKVIPSGKGIAATGRYYPMGFQQNWDIPLPSGTQFATGHDECVRAVREQVSHGERWIKLFADWGTPTFDLDEMKAIVDEARKYHVNVAAHATTKEGTKMAIEAGVRSIEHGVAFDDSLYDKSKTLKPEQKWVQPEFNPALFHKRGALAMGRDNNKAMESFTTQIYFVDGKTTPMNNWTLLKRNITCTLPMPSAKPTVPSAAHRF